MLLLYLKIPPPEVNLAITAIAKNEAPYIIEWLEFHKLVGVERFYIYDNDSTDNLKDILEPYIKKGEVVYKFFPGKNMQMPAYKDSLKYNRFKAKYMAIIDIDEFIVPVIHNTIPEFIDYLEKKINHKIDSLGINWLMHGYSGFYTKQNDGVIKTFKRCDYNYKENKTVKSIINMRSVIDIINPHFAIHRIGAKIVNSKGENMQGPYTQPNHEYIRINHYWSKSFEELVERTKKGKADGNNYPINLTFIPDYLSVDEDKEIEKFIPLLNDKLKNIN